MDHVSLMGVEPLSSLLRERADLIKLAGITFSGGSLLVSSYEIAQIILAVGAGLADDNVAEELAVTSRVSYAEKNRSNQVSVDFAKELSDRYLSYTPAIHAFLADPMNADAKDLYDAAVEDFQLKILAAYDRRSATGGAAYRLELVGSPVKDHALVLAAEELGSFAASSPLTQYLRLTQ